MKSAFFTGHRRKSGDCVWEIFADIEIEKLILSGVTDFYAGGALGWDTVCAEAVINFRAQEYPEVKLHLVLPCCEEEQTLKWTDEQKARYHEILTSADSVEYVSERYYNGCMKKRNERLVELAEYCLGYYDERRKASGTGQTVRMAQKKGIEIINARSLEQEQIQISAMIQSHGFDQTISMLISKCRAEH